MTVNIDWIEYVIDSHTHKFPLWEDDFVQFARLLAEIRAVSKLNVSALCESMDLGPKDIDELLERAESMWQELKEGLG